MQATRTAQETRQVTPCLLYQESRVTKAEIQADPSFLPDPTTGPQPPHRVILRIK